MQTELGARLRRAREAAGLAQEELAVRAGVSLNTVSGLERGEHRRPYPATLRALVAALGLDDAGRAALLAAVPSRGPSPGGPPLASEVAGSEAAGPPALLSPLIGREEAVAAVTALIEVEGARLVTLLGPGGVGKTALALRVAADLADGFPGGVAWVPCAAVRDPGLVAPTVARVLGATVGDRPGIDLIADVVRDRRLLLVLDNLEHLLAAAPLLSEALARCPRLVVLATSRAPLRLAGEHGYPVPPLALSLRRETRDARRENDDGSDVSRLTSHVSDAVRLFVARAREVDPGFSLTDENAGDVTGVCDRLDGLPLAIELAAARARILPPAAMLPRLAHRLPLLTGGRRDAPERHRTMRAAIAWSYDLLLPGEQALFRRLAVFVGGCTLEAAARVSGPHPAASVHPHVLDGIAALVDHQLLGRAGGWTGEPRFETLETIREFALERLAERGEEAEARGRHAAHVLELAEGAAPALLGPDQVAWFEALDADLDNIRAALEWLRAAGLPSETERGLRIAAALWTFWVVRDHVPEGRRWLERFLAAGATGSAVRTKALVALGDLAERQGDYDAAAAWLDEALALAVAAGDRAGEIAALRVRGIVATAQGEAARVRLGVSGRAAEEFARAEELLGRSLERAHEAGDAWGTARATHLLGVVSLVRGDWGTAFALLEEALEAFRALGDDRQVCMIAGNIGGTAVTAGDFERARTALAESLALANRLGYRWWIGYCLNEVAHMAARTGAGARAARLLGAAGTLRAATGYPLRPGPIIAQDQTIAALAAELGPDATADALAFGAAMPIEAAIAEAELVCAPPRPSGSAGGGGAPGPSAASGGGA